METVYSLIPYIQHCGLMVVNTNYKITSNTIKQENIIREKRYQYSSSLLSFEAYIDREDLLHMVYTCRCGVTSFGFIVP